MGLFLRTVKWPAATAPAAAAAEPCTGRHDGWPFRVVTVKPVAVGGTVVTWSLESDYTGVNDTEVTLEYSRGSPDDWRVTGVPAVDPAYMSDPQQRLFSSTNDLLYRVVLRIGDVRYPSKPVRVDGSVDRRSHLWAVELVRKERLRMTAGRAGVYGYLLKERRWGVRCGCVDPATGEQGSSTCVVCYGRNYVGGYHPPVACWYADPSPEEIKAMVDHAGGRGTVADGTVFARMPADVPLTANDVWVDHGSDERYRVQAVRELAAVRGFPVVYGVVLGKVPRSDVVYRLPIARVAPPDAACGSCQEV